MVPAPRRRRQDNQKFKIGVEAQWPRGLAANNHQSLSLDPSTHKTSQTGTVMHACDPGTEWDKWKALGFLPRWTLGSEGDPASEGEGSNATLAH